MAGNLKMIEKLIAGINATSFARSLFAKMREAFGAVYKDTQTTYDFQLGTPDTRAIKDLENRAIILSQKTTDRLKGDLRYELLEGMQAGEGADNLSRRIKNVFEGDTVNTERIARNEIIISSKRGTLEAYEDAGVWGREWMTHMDARTCALCKKMDGKQAKTGESFKHPETGADIPNDHMHIQCRCTTKPIMEQP